MFREYWCWNRNNCVPLNKWYFTCRIKPLDLIKYRSHEYNYCKSIRHIGTEKKDVKALVVAQSAEWSLPKPEDLGLNPVISNLAIYCKWRRESRIRCTEWFIFCNQALKIYWKFKNWLFTGFYFVYFQSSISRNNETNKIITITRCRNWISSSTITT